MTEIEKLEAGLEYCYDDPEVEARKENAIIQCKEYNAIDDTDYEAQYAKLKEMLGSVGKKVWIAKNFNCDNGKKIHIGDNFTGNYNLTVLDIREVYIGDNVMIGPNTLITTVNHPLTPKERRQHLGIAKPVTIGNETRIIVYKDEDENNSKRKSYKQLMDAGENNYTQDKYDKYCDWWGVYFLQTNTTEPADVVYADYKARWSIETFNNYIKNDAHFNDLKIQDYYVDHGFDFIMLVTGLIHSKLNDAVKNLTNHVYQHLMYFLRQDI